MFEHESFLFTIRLFFEEMWRSIQTVEKLVWTGLDTVQIRSAAPLLHTGVPRDSPTFTQGSYGEEGVMARGGWEVEDASPQNRIAQ